MSLLVNIHQLEDHNESLAGDLSVTDMGLGFEDEIVKFAKPLTYRLEAQHLQDSLLVSGELELPVECACIRCLKPVKDVIRIQDWHCHIPLVREDQPPIV